ncbi:radical SAM protein [Carbonactinospora thermoautotrophica]|uniref:radical SAM protein n=1 Tax=Carbonactinospora thermoautotrophica TaxID=1469144 RepID=UPI00099F0232|nr:radical SAM protein [Carbonactinospora thermoautotrophica]
METDFDRYISREFSTVVVQPTSLCNLDCSYCYLPVRKQRREMTPEVAHAVARSIAAQAASHPVSVVWHGGEPLALPRVRFEALLRPFEELREQGMIQHEIQTNATFITSGWCDLFARYGIEVGVSIDGPAVANINRRDWMGRPARYVQEFTTALNMCREGCPLFSFCLGAQAGNRYFECGTFAVAETNYCRNTRKALVMALADVAQEGDESDRIRQT